MPIRRPPGTILRILLLVSAWISCPTGRFPAYAAEPAPRTAEPALRTAEPAPPAIPFAPFSPSASVEVAQSDSSDPSEPSFPSTAAFPPAISKARVAISDLRVYLEYDEDTSTFASWPVDKFGRKLPADQIARAVRMGLALWASVLPDMRFRLVNRASEANLLVRFGDYKSSGFGDAGGRAFLPTQWSTLDPECGRKRENRGPDGSPCEEWEHNIILMKNGRWAVKGADYRGNLEVYRYFAWIFDPAHPHYSKAGRCRDGRDSSAAWSDACVDFRRAPGYDSLQGVDLASVFQHEFGHALLGDHTYNDYECIDYHRRPIVSKDKCTRMYEGGFSSLFPGDGVDGWWNRRGIFEADAIRLKRMGYRVSYPVSRATIVLTRPGGAFIKTSDWREAQRAMIWPLQAKPLTPAQAKRELFVTELRLDSLVAGP
ncbi:MAG: hypothetical protein JWP91_1452 [Fibrobacteres bacterium]|nr:hypothetical protein [Fibrobacterota bacterium]